MNEDPITNVLMEHTIFSGIMASPTHWAYRGDWAPEGSAPRLEGETPGKWFAHCGTWHEDQRGCGWDSEPITYPDKMTAKRAGMEHLAEEIRKAS